MVITERTTHMSFNGGILFQVSVRPKLGICQVKNNSNQHGNVLSILNIENIEKELLK